MTNTPPTGTTPTTPQQIADLNALTDATKAANAAQGDLGTTFSLVQSAMDLLNDKLNRAGISMNNITALTNQQVEQFTILSTGIIKAREAFEGFAGVDYSGLSTFKSQVDDIRGALLSGNTALSDATSLVKTLTDGLRSSGVSRSLISEAIKKGASAVGDLASGLITHADNMLRLQTAYVQMAARTGELGAVWDKTGGNLENMNALLEKQTMMIADSIEATGLSANQVEKYYSQLGQIPGALTSVINISGKAGSATSMLTAAMQVAAGTGRDQADVMDDLKKAFQDYGLVGEDALKFSVRMSEVSTKLKAPIEDVKRALMGSADAFKMFASSQENASKQSEGLASVMNAYGKALEGTGLSATQAVNVVGEMTTQISRLSIAQKAFISSQTGGPGGLMGGFQIEKRLMEGDVEGVLKDSMKTLQRQFGHIITIDEASRSQSAASMYEKQRLLLTQGPLGGIVKDEATATKLLQAYKDMQSGKGGSLVTALSKSPVQDAAEKGMKLQEGSYSELTKIRGAIERMRYLADIGSGGMAQTMTARSGTPGLPTEAQGAQRTNLLAALTQAREAGDIRAASGPGDTLNKDAATTLKGAATSLKDVPIFLRGTLDTLMGVVKSGDQEAINQQKKNLEAETAAKKTLAQQTAGTPAGRKAQEELGAEKKLYSTFFNPDVSSPSLPSAHQVGAAATRTAGRTGATSMQGAGTGPASHGATGVAASGKEMTIHVIGNFSIDCPHCGRPTNISNQALTTTPSAFTTQH